MRPTQRQGSKPGFSDYGLWADLRKDRICVNLPADDIWAAEIEGGSWSAVEQVWTFPADLETFRTIPPLYVSRIRPSADLFDWYVGEQIARRAAIDRDPTVQRIRAELLGLLGVPITNAVRRLPDRNEVDTRTGRPARAEWVLTIDDRPGFFTTDRDTLRNPGQLNALLYRLGRPKALSRLTADDAKRAIPLLHELREAIGDE